MSTLKQLRQQIIHARQSQNNARCQHASSVIAKHLFALDVFHHSQHIACYLSHKKEVDTQTIIEQIWQLGKHCYLPIITADKNLYYASYNKKTPMKKNQYRLLEPDADGKNLHTAKQIDLLITPLVMFDQNCTRIGWGHGHYDRSLSFLKHIPRPNKPYLLGLAYELQKQTHLKCESWDIPLDGVITETNIYYPKEKS